jgi:hypothetical protein
MCSFVDHNIIIQHVTCWGSIATTGAERVEGSSDFQDLERVVGYSCITVPRRELLGTQPLLTVAS